MKRYRIALTCGLEGFLYAPHLEIGECISRIIIMSNGAEHRVIGIVVEEMD